MIKKIGFVVIFTTLSAVQSLAHDFFVDGYNSSTFKAILGYGHDFPYPEKISEDRLDIFEPISIIDKDLKITTLKNDENYKYSSKKSLDDGTYILKSRYKTTYWTKTIDNKWEMGKTKKDIRNSQYCEKVTMFAKSIINIGKDTNDFITKSIGQNLEIIPLDNPSNFKVGKPFKVKILLDGKPAKTIAVKGTFDSFIKNQFAFYGKTDLKGEIEILPLRGGKWILMTENIRKLDESNCDDELLASTLTFQIQ
ncbi:DUF4198 domain-containing protein [Aliarcobacter lanthieri]|uniref:DUF4198 domain-containing protein n=1 Tax=Aliarcobacter lanthieri TaxID=1355374 RepID=UPI003AFB387D